MRDVETLGEIKKINYSVRGEIMRGEKIQIINKKFWIWMFILSVLQRPIHEFGHWIFYKLYGIGVHYTFNQVVPYQLKDVKVLGEAGGPIMNVVLAILGYIIFIKYKKYSEFGLALSLTNILGRLVPYLVIFIFGAQSTNDEGVIGILSGTNIYLYYIIFAVFLTILLLANIVRVDFAGNNKIIFALITLFIFGLGTLVIGEIIQQMFFKDYYVDFYKAVEILKQK